MTEEQAGKQPVDPQAEAADATGTNPAAGDPAQAQPAQFDGLTQGTGAGGAPGIDVILDVNVTLSLEVGRTEITVKELMQMSQGSIVELDRLAGEPLDVLVNGTLVAHGEVVVVNDNFGIRLTDVVSASERMERVS